MTQSINFAIGSDDFESIINRKNTYIDKSLLIRDLIQDGSSVLLFPRPRRFGKTLNMSMLKYFLNIREREKTKDLFQNLLITQDSEIMKHQGKYPVIFLSLKEIKKNNFEEALEAFSTDLYLLFSSFRDLKNKLPPEQEAHFDRILNKTASKSELTSSLVLLSQALEKVYGEKVWILIDEYDTPIHEAWHHGYYNEMKSLMQSFLGAALKSNTCLYKGVLTGILRVSKEGMFSELNNIKVHSMLSERYGEYFGFTESEVDWICEKANLKDQRTEARAWYNGYKFGTIDIYNPWSIINFVAERKVAPYWVNTGNNKLIETLISQAPGSFKIDFEVLIQGGILKKSINENISLPMINSTINSNVEDSLWNFLLFAGYLKVLSIEHTDQAPLCEITIPNTEVLGMYKAYFVQWLSPSGSGQGNLMLNALTSGNIELFETLLQDFMETSFSYFDAGGKNPEKVYHALILGMLVSLKEHYEISSNGEAGYGRYDLILIPKDLSKLGLVLEFKTVPTEKLMNKAAKEALSQINNLGYAKKIEARGIKKVLKLGLIFCGKKVIVKKSL